MFLEWSAHQEWIIYNQEPSTDEEKKNQSNLYLAAPYKAVTLY